MTSAVLESRFTVSNLTRHCQSVWHDLLVEFAKAERIFRCNGHTREADQLIAYMNTLNQHGVRHLERLLGANGNGHHKDSTVGTELPVTLAASEDPSVNGQAPSDEAGAREDVGSHEQLRAPPCVSEAVTADVPGDVEGRIELLIDQLGDLMAKQPDHQPYEVALKMCHKRQNVGS